MPGLVNDFMALPPEQKQQLLRFAGDALGARGGDINNVATKLQANPALAMQMMERSGIGVANPIGGASGDRAAEPDFASMVSRTMQDRGAPQASAPKTKSAVAGNGAQGNPSKSSQRSGSGDGGSVPSRSGPTAERTLAGGQADERFQGPRVAAIQEQPPRRPTDGSVPPATNRPGDGGMGVGTLMGGGAAALLAAEAYRRAQASRRNPAAVRDAKLIQGNPELVTMDEVMGVPKPEAVTGNERPEFKRQFTEGGPDEAMARPPHEGEVDDYVPRNRGGDVPDEPAPKAAPQAKAPQANAEANAGPAPVDLGNAPPGKEASDLATFKEVYEGATGDDKATKQVDTSKRDARGYERSQQPENQVEYGKPRKGVKVKGKFKPNVRFK
jgi:hypothetical protein